MGGHADSLLRFLRVSEYTAQVSSYDHDSTLCYGDVSWTDNNLVQVLIKTSKTDPFRLGATIRLAPNKSSLCPVTALHRFMNVHPTKEGPLFTFHNGRFLTRNDLMGYLKRFLPSDVANISTHSFRIGAATTAARVGHPKWLIQSLGRWTSDCFQEYIRIPDDTIKLVSSSMLEHQWNSNVFDPDLC